MLFRNTRYMLFRVSVTTSLSPSGGATFILRGQGNKNGRSRQEVDESAAV